MAFALGAFGEAMVPTLTFFAILWGVPESEPLPGRSLDAGGFVLLALALLTITSGLTFLKIGGADAWWRWAVMLVGVALLLPRSAPPRASAATSWSGSSAA